MPLSISDWIDYTAAVTAQARHAAREQEELAQHPGRDLRHIGRQPSIVPTFEKPGLAATPATAG